MTTGEAHLSLWWSNSSSKISCSQFEGNLGFIHNPMESLGGIVSQLSVRANHEAPVILTVIRMWPCSANRGGSSASRDHFLIPALSLHWSPLLPSSSAQDWSPLCALWLRAYKRHLVRSMGALDTCNFSACYMPWLSLTLVTYTRTIPRAQKMHLQSEMGQHWFT